MSGRPVPHLQTRGEADTDLTRILYVLLFKRQHLSVNLYWVFLVIQGILTEKIERTFMSMKRNLYQIHRYGLIIKTI